MKDSKPYSIPVAAVWAIVFIGLNLANSREPHIPGSFADGSILYGLAILMLPATLFGFWLPLMKVGSWGRWWKLPKSTMMIPKWMIRVVVSIQLGLLIGLIVLAVVLDSRYGIAFLLMLPGVSSLLWSASIRFKRPDSEFTAPFSIWRLFRR